MEQNIQQQTAENKLPAKTKIAAWWMVIFFGFLFIFGLLAFLFFLNTDFEIDTNNDPVLIFLAAADFFLLGYMSLVFLIAGFINLLLAFIFLETKKKILWFLNVGALIIESVVYILFSINHDAYFFDGKPLFLIVFIFIIPLFLFFFDRKNFWQVVK
jgi:hypothetical protein